MLIIYLFDDILIFRKEGVGMHNIGQRIKQKREELGWTQEELATKMGYKSKSTINKIEMCINDVSQSKVVKFAEVLGTSVAHLMGWDQEEIDAVAEMQKEANEYSDRLKNEFKTFMEEFGELELTNEELQEVFDYAKYVKSKRK